MWDWANISNFVAIGAALLAIGGFYWRLVYELKNFREDVIDIKIDLKQLNKVIMDLALQNQRLNNLETMVLELRHGKGLVDAH